MPFALQHDVSCVCKMFVTVLLSKCDMGSLFKHKTDPHQDLAVKFLSQQAASYISIHSSASEFHLPRQMCHLINDKGVMLEAMATTCHVVFPGSEPDLFYQMLVEGLLSVAVLF
jgi:hypothetical protein